MNRTGVLLLVAMLGCAPVRSTPPSASARAPLVPPLTEPERIRQMETDLARLTTADAESHAVAYARLSQRARDGDRAARTVQLVFGIRDSLREGCEDEADALAFTQQLELLSLHLAQASPGEQVFAGPTLLLALQANGRAEEQPGVAGVIVRAGRSVWADHRLALGELLAEVAHALRLGCHLRAALPLLEEAVALLQLGPEAVRSEPALLARRDLATLRFLLGDAQSAERELAALGADLLQVVAGEDLQARMEVVQVLRRYFGAADGSPPPPPRETGPGWQALRTVQQQASCPEATPADPRLVRVPLPPPACQAASGTRFSPLPPRAPRK
ncbi:MAG: hypothetical protein RMK29_04485 [Myxococcales bacterium]|nr:hypothetical protein [Myxococcota bacterium]MDW8280946.1 hypothetical protein [Myxococcales bacterium]